MSYRRRRFARFAVESAEVTDDHRRQLLNNAGSYVSEAAGKYKTRYRSAGVLSLEAHAPVPAPFTHPLAGIRRCAVG